MGALFGALALLALVAASELITAAKSLDTRELIASSREVLHVVVELRFAIADAVANRRACALAPDSNQTAALKRSIELTRHEQSLLRALTAGRAQQQARLDQLEPSIAALLDGLLSATAGDTRPSADAQAQIVQREISAYTVVTAHLQKLSQAELDYLTKAQLGMRSFSAHAREVELIGVLISAALLLFVFRKLKSEIGLRERSESALRESELRLATTLDSIGDGVIVTDTEARVTRMNPVAERLTGLGLAEARGRAFSEVFPVFDEDSHLPAIDSVQRVLREGAVVGLANHRILHCRDGSQRPIADSAAPIRDHAGPITGVVMVFRDMSGERAARQHAHDTAAFLDSIVENIPNMVFVKEPRELRFVRFNKAGEELLGTPRSALIGKNDFDFFPADQAVFFQAKDRDVLAKRTLLDIPEEPIRTPAGERWLHTKKIPILDDDGTPRYLLGISEDITEKKRIGEQLLQAKAELEQRVAERTRDLVAANDELKREMNERRLAEAALQRSEEQLRQSQKLEAIGKLAGGVAHDFNNLLSVILSYGESVQRALPADTPLRAEVEQITRAGARAADLTRQLLAFSRQQMLAPKIVDLNSSLDSMHKMLQRVIGEDIELRTLPNPRLGRVRVDPGQIEQVILNLAVNARDAMPNGGILSIETGNVDLDAVYAAEHPGIAPGPHVMLAVTDSGVGMSRTIQERVFEPFFTTKEQGKGTGLGLSTVFGIVQQSGGSIWLYSELDRGTTFKLYFPRVPHEDSRSGVPATRLATVSGSETILLVEDDEQVRTLAKTVLERSGFHVIVASGYEQAMKISAGYEDAIQLLVTDVVMPRVSGRQLAEELAQQRPNMKVLFMSGYTDDTVVHHGVLDAGIHFLQKPLTPDMLTRKVREVLDSAR